MKVFYITMQFPAPSETFATNDVRVLRQSGIDVSVHSLRSSHPRTNDLLQERDLENVTVTYGDFVAFMSGLKHGLLQPFRFLKLLVAMFRHCWRKPQHLAKSLFLAPRAFHLLSVIREQRPDVVHIYWGHYPSLVGYLVQCHLPNIVVSISLAAYDLEMQYDFSKTVARRADMVRTLAQVNVDQIHEYFGVPKEKVTDIPDGVDLENFRNVSSVRDHVNRRIVSAGRLIPSKGTADVLVVFSKIIRTFPDATLTLLGDGPERSRLEALANALNIDDAVQFLGHVSHEQVFAELVRAEVFLFMSKKDSERLPNVVKEAMGCKCLCVVTATPGMNELITHGESGWIVEQEDVETAAKFIEQAFQGTSRDVIARMTEAAHQHLSQHFSLRKCVEKYIETWAQLVDMKQNEIEGPAHASYGR